MVPIIIFIVLFILFLKCMSDNPPNIWEIIASLVLSAMIVFLFCVVVGSMRVNNTEMSSRTREIVPIADSNDTLLYVDKDEIGYYYRNEEHVVTLQQDANYRAIVEQREEVARPVVITVCYDGGWDWWGPYNWDDDCYNRYVVPFGSVATTG